MADVKMPKSIPCKFNAKGYAPCNKPSTNGWCSKHETLKCVSCGKHATRSCEEGLSLCCGASLCGDCQHSLEGSEHVSSLIFKIQERDRAELRKTGKESDRALSLRGIPTHVPLPSNLEELMTKKWERFFTLKLCFYLVLKNGCMGTFPAILKEKDIFVLTSDKDSIIQVWRSLEPRDSEVASSPWMVHENIGVAYRVPQNRSEWKESRAQKLFIRDEIENLFAKDSNPFVWAPGLWGGSISRGRFEELINAA